MLFMTEELPQYLVRLSSFGSIEHYFFATLDKKAAGM